MKVLVATEKPFSSSALDSIRRVIEEAGWEFDVLEKYTAKQELLNAVADADALIVRSDIVDEQVLEAAHALKIVVRAGAGYDNIDLLAATAHGVVVMITPGQNSNAVAELAIGMMIMAVRNFYRGTSGTELKGKKIGIHAFGNVGRCVAHIAQGLGMDVYAYDAFCTDDRIREQGVTPLHSAEELYATCSIVSVHIPATAETKGSITASLLQTMPKGAVLVNTARKEVIKEDDLIRVMQERTDMKYVTDVMPDGDAKMREMFADRYFATPKKMGAQTAEANANAGVAAAQQIKDFFEKGITRFQVNK